MDLILPPFPHVSSLTEVNGGNSMNKDYWHEKGLESSAAMWKVITSPK